MPTYKNISNATYCNTKYNIFNIDPGETFEIDKEINSPSLQKIADTPNVKYEGDIRVSLSPGNDYELDLTDKLEIGVYAISIADTDSVEVSINQHPDDLNDEEKTTVTQTVYFHETEIQLKGYNRIYLKAPSSNASPAVVRLAFRYI